MNKLFIIFFLFIINNSYSAKYYLSYDIKYHIENIINENFQSQNISNKYRILDTSQIDNINDSKANYLYNYHIIANDPTLQKQVFWNKYYFLDYNTNREKIFININNINFLQLSLIYFEGLNLKKMIIDNSNIDLFDQIIIDNKQYIILPNDYRILFLFVAHIVDANPINLEEPIKYKILEFKIAKKEYVYDYLYNLQSSFLLNYCKISLADYDYDMINYFYSKKNKKCILINFHQSLDTKFNFHDINQLIEINNILDLDDELIHPFFSNVKIYKSK